MNRSDPQCLISQYYAEQPRRNAPASGTHNVRRGIIRVSALWVLCRCRHKTHWTGHPSRLDRDLSGHFGSRHYAREELVAEMASAFVCASLGIVPTVRHADYLGSWLDVLREDNQLALF
jgi:antirestriction protein ArdC